MGYFDRFTVMQAVAGQRMLLGDGAEFVLRTGAAAAIRGELGCIADLISGRDLDAGDEVLVNHLLISSRSDNRGVRFTEDAYFLVKGGYDLR